MLWQCIRERLISLFTVARSAFQLLDERLNVEPISGLEVSAVPVTVLVKRHGRLQTGILCALVESMAFLALLFKNGVEPSILSTIPILGSRFQIIVLVAFVYIVSHLVSLGMKVIAYLGYTCLGMKLKRPVLCITRLLHTILSSNDYLPLAKDYCKALPGYAFSQAETKLYKPWKAKANNMRKSSSIAAFVYRRILEFIAFPVFSLSVTCAFFFVYATADINSPQPVLDDGVQEVSNTIGSSVPSADTTSTAVDTRPSDNAASALEITESEDTAAAAGLLDEMKSFKDAQHSSETVEDEVLRDAAVDEGLVVQDVAEEKVADEDTPIQAMVEEELGDEQEVVQQSNAEEALGDIVAEVEAGVDAESEAEVNSSVEIGDTSDLVEVVEEEVPCDQDESGVDDVEEPEQGEEVVEGVGEEARSVDVDDSVEEVSGEVEEEVDEIEEAEELDGQEVEYVEESGEIEEAEFAEEVSGEAEFAEEVPGEAEEEVYEEEEEYKEVDEVSGEVEEASEVSGEAEEEAEYAEEDEQEESDEVEEVFEYDEEPRRVEPDLYVPRDGAEYPVDEPQQEEEDLNAVEGLGWNSIRVNLSAESLVSATIDHANMGLLTSVETKSVLINIVASSTVASLGREGDEDEDQVAEGEEEVEVEEDDGQEQGEPSVVTEAEEPEREVEVSKVAVTEQVELVKAGKEETLVHEGLAHQADIAGEGPDETGTQLETEAEKERLHKMRVREIARKMAKGGVLSAEEKVILLSSYSRKKESAAETKSAQLEVNGGVPSAANGVTSDAEGVKVGDEAVSTRPALSSPTPSTEETPQADVVIGVASADVQMEEKPLDVIEAEAEVRDDEPERPELMQVKSPRVEFRSRALSLDAIVGMQALSFSSFALGGVQNAFEIPPRLLNNASGSLSRRTLSLGEWAAAPIIPVLVEAPRRPLKMVHRRRRHMSLP